MFRAIAVLAVVLGHGSEFIDIGVNSWFPVDGVDMFFVLSGFLIGRILLKQDKTNDRSFFLNTLTFYKRRWFRTLPNYLLFLVINLIMIKIGVYDGILNINSLAYFVFLQNFIKPLDLMFWESWSLAVEEWFYLLFPLLISIILIFSKPKSYKKSYLLICILFLTVPLGLRIIQFDSSFGANDVDLFIRKIVIYRLDTIAFGLLGAYIFTYFGNFFKKYSFIFFALGIVGIFFLKTYSFESNTLFRQTFYYSLQSLFILLWIPVIYRIEKTKSVINKPISFISIISYALYLIHMPVLYLITKYQISLGINTIDFIGYILISIILSYFIYRIWEKPMTDLRNREFKILNFRF